MDFVQHELGLDFPADHNAHQHRAQRHRKAFGHHIHEVQPAVIPAGDTQRLTGDPNAVGAEAVHSHEGGFHHNSEAYDQNGFGAVGLFALLDRPVHEERGDNLDQRDGGGDGGDQHQQIEDHAEQRADVAHAVEHVLQRDEQEAGTTQSDLAHGNALLDAIGHGGGNDGDAGHNSDRGIGNHDDAGVFDQIFLLIEVRTVSNHGAHSQRQGEEHLPAGGGNNGTQIGCGFDETARHRVAGDEHELQALDSARQGQALDDDDDQHHEQGGHTDIVEFLNAAGDTAAVDEVADNQEQQSVDHAAPGIRQHGAEQVAAGNRFGLEGQIAQIQSHILDAVAAQHGIEAHDDERRKDRQPTDPFEPAGHRMIRPDGSGAGFAAQRQFCHHNGEAHEKRQQQVDDQEGKSPRFTHLVRKAPNVAEADGRANCRQQEADVASPTASLVFHK
ncbi:hypothetical protein SDC9_90565 [bioreactor metagenome]|uniref:Uncharacterized protein n=1 Tax=bioreactor metagenome TaxID=1076179 RepID=A0A644ZU06_9ZZZZ